MLAYLMNWGHIHRYWFPWESQDDSRHLVTEEDCYLSQDFESYIWQMIKLIMDKINIGLVCNCKRFLCERAFSERTITHVRWMVFRSLLLPREGVNVEAAKHACATCSWRNANKLLTSLIRTIDQSTFFFFLKITFSSSFFVFYLSTCLLLVGWRCNKVLPPTTNNCLTKRSLFPLLLI